MVTRLPTFLHIGPGKSGSSWLHETLALHPEVYLSEAKDLYFFSRYCTRLQRYLDCFGRQALHVAVFDHLRADPQAFLDGVTTWLQIDRLVLAPELLGARQPASDARWLPLATVAKRAAGVVGWVKRSAVVQRVLYEPLGDSRPVMPPADAAFVREHLEAEVAGVERRLGIPLRQLWNWPGGQDHG